jgi:hypothetical protein
VASVHGTNPEPPMSVLGHIGHYGMSDSQPY